jgi:hypothetical protein
MSTNIPTDALGRCINVGDKVLIMQKNYCGTISYIIVDVVSFTPTGLPRCYYGIDKHYMIPRKDYLLWTEPTIPNELLNYKTKY